MTIQITKNPARGEYGAHWVIRCDSRVAGWISLHPGSPAGDAVLMEVPKSRLMPPPASVWSTPEDALHELLDQWIDDLGCVETAVEYWEASPRRDDPKQSFFFDTISDYWEAAA